MSNFLRKDIRTWDPIPKWYGLGRWHIAKDGGYAYIIPFNIIVALFTRIYDFFKSPKFIEPTCEMEAYKKGQKDFLDNLVLKLVRERNHEEWQKAPLEEKEKADEFYKKVLSNMER